MKKIFFVAVALFLLWTTNYGLPTASAAVPHLINYQGRLTDKVGKPLEGAHAITFRIYDAAAAGNLLWEETYSALLIQKGIFSVMLGSVSTLDLAFDRPYYLEIKVGTDVMSPRQQLTSVGYAIKAEKADDLNISAQQGDILYFDGSKWTKLAAGPAGFFLKSQGAGSVPVWASASGFNNIQVFTADGTFIKPPGVDKVFVEVVGGGGGGGFSGDGIAGGGGGGGGYAAKLCTLTGNVAVIVGKGGTGGTGALFLPRDGSSGGTSSFGSSCFATAGEGGVYSGEGDRYASCGGIGGRGVDGDINIPGQGGAFGGEGGNSTLGMGGRPDHGRDGNVYGGGGTGGAPPHAGPGTSGGNGAGGVVIVKW